MTALNPESCLLDPDIEAERKWNPVIRDVKYDRGNYYEPRHKSTS